MFKPDKNLRYKLNFQLHSADPKMLDPKNRTKWISTRGFVDVLPAGIKPWRIPFKVNKNQVTTHLQANIGRARFVVQQGKGRDAIILIDYSTRPVRFYGANPSRSEPGKWAVWVAHDPQVKIDRYASKSTLVRTKIFVRDAYQIDGEEVQRLIYQIRDENPDYEVFLSADHGAIVGYDRKEWIKAHAPKSKLRTWFLDSLFSWARSKFTSDPDEYKIKCESCGEEYAEDDLDEDGHCDECAQEIRIERRADMYDLD